jgi:4'-phosphopantetheinyl transferase
MGKPYYENGPYFNVSHSGKYVMMAVSSREIGIDIEENIPKDMSLLTKIFNEAEAKMIKEHADFYYLWCAKESLIKCMGSSISHIKEIPSLPFNGVKTYKGKDYQCQTFIFDKHIVSITREGYEKYELKIEKVHKL